MEDGGEEGHSLRISRVMGLEEVLMETGEGSGILGEQRKGAFQEMRKGVGRKSI